MSEKSEYYVIKNKSRTFVYVNDLNPYLKLPPLAYSTRRFKVDDLERSGEFNKFVGKGILEAVPADLAAQAIAAPPPARRDPGVSVRDGVVFAKGVSEAPLDGPVDEYREGDRVRLRGNAGLKGELVVYEEADQRWEIALDDGRRAFAPVRDIAFEDEPITSHDGEPRRTQMAEDVTRRGRGGEPVREIRKMDAGQVIARSRSGNSVGHNRPATIDRLGTPYQGGRKFRAGDIIGRPAATNKTPVEIQRITPAQDMGDEDGGDGGTIIVEGDAGGKEVPLTRVLKDTTKVGAHVMEKVSKDLTAEEKKLQRKRDRRAAARTGAAKADGKQKSEEAPAAPQGYSAAALGKFLSQPPAMQKAAIAKMEDVKMLNTITQVGEADASKLATQRLAELAK